MTTTKSSLLKKLFTSISIVVLAFSLTVPASAVNSVTGGYFGISSYSYCGYGNRAGVSYVYNLSTSLAGVSLNNNNLQYTESYRAINNDVTTTNIAGASQVTFFVYSGHGLNYSATSNALHVNKPSSGTTTSHSTLGENTSTLINLKTISTSFCHKYVTLYTCNQLTNSGNSTKAVNILGMMNGTRLIMGFASTMYLDSREGTLYGTNMEYYTIVNSYIYAAQRYQPQRSSGDSIARVVGYTAASSDNILANYSYAPSYSSSPSSFDVISTVTIPHTGVLV